MYTFTSNDDPDLDELRARLRKMTDAELLGYGHGAAWITSNSAR
jgi:hypothetical protein